MLRIENVTIVYIGSEGPAVSNVSLDIKSGEIFALVGESGSGKSTLLQSILRILPSPGVIKGGSIYFRDQNIFDLSVEEIQRFRWRSISMVFQSALAALHPTNTIKSLFKDTIQAHNERWDMEKVRDLLRIVDLSENVLDLYPHELSGGMRQRVVIALSMLLRPSMILLDEPTTALDVLVEKQIMRTLVRLQKEYGFAIIMVTHDLPMILKYAHRIGIMKDGILLEVATADDIQKEQQHPYTTRLLESQLSMKPEQSINTSVMLDVEHLEKFYGETRVVKDVSFHVFEGEIVGLIGGSGSGKSTIAKIVCGLVQRSKGSFTLQGEELIGVSSQIQMVFQDPFSALNPVHTIDHHLRIPLRKLRKLSKKDCDGEIKRLLQLVDLPLDFQHRFPYELSGGQRQRIVIARALATNPKLLIADEPTSMLDLSLRKDLLDLFEKLRQKGLSIIFITHDLHSAGYLCDRIIVLQQGRIVEENHTTALFSHPQHTYTKQLLENL